MLIVSYIYPKNACYNWIYFIIKFDSKGSLLTGHGRRAHSWWLESSSSAAPSLPADLPFLPIWESLTLSLALIRSLEPSSIARTHSHKTGFGNSATCWSVKVGRWKFAKKTFLTELRLGRLGMFYRYSF